MAITKVKQTTTGFRTSSGLLCDTLKRAQIVEIANALCRCSKWEMPTSEGEAVASILLKNRKTFIELLTTIEDVADETETEPQLPLDHHPV